MTDTAAIGLMRVRDNGVGQALPRVRQALAGSAAAMARAPVALTALAARCAGLMGPARAAAVALQPAWPKPVPAVTAGADAAPQEDPTPATMPIRVPVQPTVPWPVMAGAPAGNVPGGIILPDFSLFGRALAAPARSDTAREIRMRDQGVATTMAVGTAPPEPVPAGALTTSAMPDDITPIQSERRAISAPIALLASAAKPSRPDASTAAPQDDAARAEGGDMAAGPVEITLDGAVLARWIGTMLAADASRAPAGATAFDPRLSPLWMGS